MEDLVQGDLVVDPAAIAAGKSFPIGVRLRLAEDWHVYWQNPGDAGLPTRIDWTLPAGFDAGPIQWPTPIRFEQGPVVSFGYADEVVHLTDVKAPADLQQGAELDLQAEVRWLVCKEECIPGRATLQQKVKVGAADEKAASALAAAAKMLPTELPWPASLRTEKEGIRLQVDAPALGKATVTSAFFFPGAAEQVEHGAAQKLERSEAGLSLLLAQSALAAEAPTALEGILVFEEDLGGSTAKQAFTLRATTAKAAAIAAAPTAAAGGESDEGGPGLLQALGLALLGGIVLNLMPCVFPVLSLKVLGVAQQASESPGRIRLHGVAYTAGILASFGALAGGLLLLRAGGAQIGWGFQLQSPAFVTVLTYVLLAMALSLSGVLHFGGSIVGVGNSLASRPGLSGSFFTGVLATVVATPCTAPFMGAAIGYAILQPAVVALSIFLALGLGLALPFLALSFVPAMHRLLPRPGAWMETLKQALAFPLYGTVAWLVWVLHLQVGSEGLAAVLAGLVLVAFAAWAWGSSRLAGTLMRRVGATSCIGAVAVASLLLFELPEGAAPAEAATPAGAKVAAEPWSEEKVDALLASDKPVFVNFTAAWCVTCLVNERTAMSTEGVQDLFAEKGVTYLKGDWTNRDPAITRTLEKYGRSGVPLYLFYRGDGSEPVVLPQILTEATVREHLETL